MAGLYGRGLGIVRMALSRLSAFRKCLRDNRGAGCRSAERVTASGIASGGSASCLRIRVPPDQRRVVRGGLANG
jgi:hypothetical protein